MFDEALLDDPARLASRDEGRLLWALATAGAQVRRADTLVAESQLNRIRTDGLPRALLVATDALTTGVAPVLAALALPGAPTLTWTGADLPRWAGTPDALIVVTADGQHPRLVNLVDQASRRGLALVVVAPPNSAVARGSRGPVLELPADLHRRALLWAALIPALRAGEELGVIAPDSVPSAEIADALDEMAEACRPDSDAFTNPAKALATEFGESTPLIAGAGPLASAAAALFADTLRIVAGAPAVWVSLPDKIAVAGGLLAGEASEDDFFRDRSEPEPFRPRVVVIGDEGDPDDPALGALSDAERQLGEVAALRAARALRQIAAERGVRASTVDVPPGAPLSRFAAAQAFGSFVAAYLALAKGLDPSAPRPGELAH